VATPFTACFNLTNFQTPVGWIGVGGTSLSSPLWSAIAANHVGFWGHRIGNANPLLYLAFNVAYSTYFNDITGRWQTIHNNGFFPAVPGYDFATGIGTPIMNALITHGDK